MKGRSIRLGRQRTGVAVTPQAEHAAHRLARAADAAASDTDVRR